jgi:soluble lytic murein transglycosylase
MMPRDQLTLLYPAPYVNTLVRSADERGVDARLLLSIMRQESRFNGSARSDAGALGLMQFIPTTADQIAGELGRKRFSQDDLAEPSTAIMFGAQYAADLFSLFPNQPEAVVAGYNAGDESVRRWLTRSRTGLSDRYVAEMMYTQTKDYVYKVMANYRMYQYLYDEELRPR